MVQLLVGVCMCVCNGERTGGGGGGGGGRAYICLYIIRCANVLLAKLSVVFMNYFVTIYNVVHIFRFLDFIFRVLHTVMRDLELVTSVCPYLLVLNNIDFIFVTIH